MQIKKAARVLSAVLLIFALSVTLPLSISAEDTEITYADANAALKEDMADPTVINTVKEAYLYCLSTETELLDFDADPETYEPPADTAKLLAALTACDMIDDFSKKVTITQKMINDSPGIRFDYKRYDEVPYRDLLCTMLMRTANDSATALAYSLCGDMTTFAAKMNEKAASLGMTSSFFTSATGAYDGRAYTTARDVFILAKAFYEDEREIFEGETLMGLVSQRLHSLSWTMPDKTRRVFNINFLLSEYYNTGKDIRDSSVTGMIVGRTAEGGDVIVRSANYNGYEYICVLLGAERDAHFTYSYTVSGELIKWGSNNYSFIKILDKNRPISSINVKNARENDSVPVVPTEDLSKYILSDAQKTGKLTTSVILSETSLTAPVAKGTPVGTVEVYYNGEKISECPLVTACEISENTTSSMIQLVWEAISSKKAITAYTVSASVVTVYVLINSVIRQKRKSKIEKDA